MLLRSLLVLPVLVPTWILWNQILLPPKTPIIGIFTQPTTFLEYNPASYTYLTSSYVKFLQQSGAKVIPIPYEVSKSELDVIFANINGIVIQGGRSLLTGPTLFSNHVAYMVNKALNSSRAGDPFPILGVCLGHQLLHYIFSGYDKSYRVEVIGQSKVLKVLEDVDREAIMYSLLSDELYETFITEEVAYYHHKYAITEDLYAKHPEIPELLRITARNKDFNGIEFVAAAEGIDLPIFTSQYHPEKSSFELTVPASHTEEAARIYRTQSLVFGDIARKNSHVCNETAMKKYLNVSLDPVIVNNNGTLQEIYIFKRSRPAEKDALIPWEKLVKAREQSQAQSQE